MPLEKLPKGVSVVLIDEKGTKLGMHRLFDAEKLAGDKNLILKKVSVDDEGIFTVRMKDPTKALKRVVDLSEAKEIRLSTMISDNDVETKERKVLSLLEQGYAVKVVVHQKKGREAFEKELANAVLNAVAEKIPKTHGRMKGVQVDDKKKELSTVFLPSDEFLDKIRQKEVERNQKKEKHYSKKEKVRDRSNNPFVDLEMTLDD